MRVRTSHAPDGWRDEGPCPDVARARNAGVEAAQIPDMLPLIVGTVHSQMSDGHGKPKAELSYSIRPENRYTLRSRRRLAPVAAHEDGQRRRLEDAPRCDHWMRIAKEPCARLPHTGKDHRSRHDLDARAARKRAKYPSRIAA